MAAPGSPGRAGARPSGRERALSPHRRDPGRRPGRSSRSGIPARVGPESSMSAASPRLARIPRSRMSYGHSGHRLFLHGPCRRPRQLPSCPPASSSINRPSSASSTRDPLYWIFLARQRESSDGLNRPVPRNSANFGRFEKLFDPLDKTSIEIDDELESDHSRMEPPTASTAIAGTACIPLLRTIDRT